MEKLEKIIEIAKKAGQFLKENSLKTLQIAEKSIGDFVTNVDKESEKIILEFLMENFPNYSILSEEKGVIGNENSEYLFAVDPLDGTTNYIKKYGFSCVSIALLKDLKPIFGVVYNPFKDELFYAKTGQGAYLNDKKITVSSVSELKNAVISSGFVFKENESVNRDLIWMKNLLLRGANIRCDGSAAIDLSYVAKGVFDGYFQRGIHLWDFASGSLIVKEAGGLVSSTPLENSITGGYLVIAGNKKIFNEISAFSSPD